MTSNDSGNGHENCSVEYEPDNSFGLAVVYELAQRDEWGPIEYTADNALGVGSLGPVEVAEAMNFAPDPGDVEAIGKVADAIVESYGYSTEGMAHPIFGPEPEEVERDFEMAVINQLLAEGDVAVARYTIEHIFDPDALDPVGIAVRLGVDADADDSEAVGLVADHLQQGYRDDKENGYDVPEGARGTSERPEDARLNDGDDQGKHLIYGELARLERAGVDVRRHRMIHTGPEDHPDYLEIHYAGVSATEIEELRYRHIGSGDYYGIASRPLSEIETRDN